MFDYPIHPEQVAAQASEPRIFSVPTAVSWKITLALEGKSVTFGNTGPKESPESANVFLEKENFRIEVTRDWKRKIDNDEWTEYLENPSGDVWMVPSTGEQHFSTSAAIRETKKAGLRIPTVEEWKKIVRFHNPKVDLDYGYQKDASARRNLGLWLNWVLSNLSAPGRKVGLWAYVILPSQGESFDRLLILSEGEISITSKLRNDDWRKVGYSVRCLRKAE